MRVVVVAQLEEASDQRHAGGRAGRPVATAGWGGARWGDRRRVGGRNLLEGGRLSPHSRTSQQFRPARLLRPAIRSTVSMYLNRQQFRPCHATHPKLFQAVRYRFHVFHNKLRNHFEYFNMFVHHELRKLKEIKNIIRDLSKTVSICKWKNISFLPILHVFAQISARL